ncbi:MAG: 23S rRNA (adenine(2503)-C(2))-methyltransferase RlmN [Thermodesulfobacteriota bacterium]|nr:MAG: 23S rRNA (adenine(2503)-C(2))-methyltransferase RlmN [Thermodesulfobacteriota bacterium]
MRNLRGFTYGDILDLVSSLGERPYRASQIYGWLYAGKAPSIDAMTDISTALRQRLKSALYIGPLEITAVMESSDGTRKLVFRLDDGAGIESVVIPGGARTTLCVSSQVGCALACAFCLTGAMGFKRNLSLAELTGQVFSAGEVLAGGPELTNIVLMGMGEPLLNCDNVVKFVNILTDAKGFGFSHNKVTVSTAGIIPGIKRLGEETDANLAVSLNAPDDELRSALMPVNKKYPLADLIEALEAYPLKGKRRITVEYVLLGGVNDADSHAVALKKILARIRCKVNLIPFNVYPGAVFRSPEEDRVFRFADILRSAGYTVVIRKSKGAGIGAACGQLKG